MKHLFNTEEFINSFVLCHPDIHQNGWKGSHLHPVYSHYKHEMENLFLCHLSDCSGSFSFILLIIYRGLCDSCN